MYHFRPFRTTSLVNLLDGSFRRTPVEGRSCLETRLGRTPHLKIILNEWYTNKRPQVTLDSLPYYLEAMI